MRVKRLTCLAACGILVVLGVGYVTAKRPAHVQVQPSVFVVGQQKLSNSVLISVLLTNPGPRTICYGNSIGSPFIDVCYLIGDGVGTNAPRSRTPGAGFYFMLPGESVKESFLLPRSITNCQIGCHFSYAGQRTALDARLARFKWLKRVLPAVKPMLWLVPNKDVKTVETWTEVPISVGY